MSFHIAVVQELLVWLNILEDPIDKDTEKGNVLD